MLTDGSVSAGGSRAEVCRCKAARLLVLPPGKVTNIHNRSDGCSAAHRQEGTEGELAVTVQISTWQLPTCRLPCRLGCSMPLPCAIPSWLRLATSQIAGTPVQRAAFLLLLCRLHSKCMEFQHRPIPKSVCTHHTPFAPAGATAPCIVGA